MIPVKNLDFMWRIAVGGIKTGDVIARYRMPGVRVDCVFCPEVRETAEHLFFHCSALYVVRNLVLSSIKDMGVDCSSMTDEQCKCLFCLSLCPKKIQKSVRRQIFSMLLKTNRWYGMSKTRFFSHMKDRVLRRCSL